MTRKIQIQTYSKYLSLEHICKNDAKTVLGFVFFRRRVQKGQSLSKYKPNLFWLFLLVIRKPWRVLCAAIRTPDRFLPTHIPELTKMKSTSFKHRNSAKSSLLKCLHGRCRAPQKVRLPSQGLNFSQPIESNTQLSSFASSPSCPMGRAVFLSRSVIPGIRDTWEEGGVGVLHWVALRRTDVSLTSSSSSSSSSASWIQ